MDDMINEGVERLPPLASTLEEFDIYIGVSDGWQSRTKVVRPKQEIRAERPLIVNFYGGGFMAGTPELLLNSARAFAKEFGAVVALPSYRLTPHVRWPTPMKDAWDAVVHLSKNAHADLGANLNSGFIVGGASAGGTLAAVCGGLAMHDPQESEKLANPITGLFLCIPSLLVDEIVPSEMKSLFTSREDNRTVESFNTDGINRINQELQCPDYTSLWFSPVNGIVKGKISTKFRVYLEHCQYDPLRDDVAIYEKLLRARGVETKIQLFPDDEHASWTVINFPRRGKTPMFEDTWMSAMSWLLESLESPIQSKLHSRTIDSSS